MNLVLNVVFLSVLVASPLGAQTFTQLWKLGDHDNNFSTDFSGEDHVTTTGNGSATALDDHYYFAGDYPSGVGVVTTSESLKNFEWALSTGDPSNVVHFNLTAAQFSLSARYRVECAFYGGGRWFNSASGPGYGVRDINVYMNDVLVGTMEDVHYSTYLDFVFPASLVNAAAENTVKIELGDSTASSWIFFDMVKLSVDESGMADADLDSLPLWWEDLYGLDDTVFADAAVDSDLDGRTNLQEFTDGTSPVNADTDHDGLNDGEESFADTDPLNEDTDGDSLLDGEELASSPLLTDTDGDGVADPVEVEAGIAANNSGSVAYQFDGAIGVNFRSVYNPDIQIDPYEQGGVVSQRFWNNTEALSHNTDASGALLNLKNSADHTTAVDITWSASNSRYSLNQGTANQKLWSAYLESEDDFTGIPAQVVISEIPTSSVYDVYVYVTEHGNNNKGAVRLNGDSSTDRYYLTYTEPPFLGFLEVTQTTSELAASGNYVRYRNVSGPTITIQNASIAGEVGIAGIQLVDVTQDMDGDNVPDYYEVQYGLGADISNAAADADNDALSNYGEFLANTNPLDEDTDRDTLKDGEEALHGADPLLSDTDGDLLLDGVEVLANPFVTDPAVVDTDGDGSSDYDEFVLGSDPTDQAITSSDLNVPVWDAANHRWVWTVDNVRMVVNHSNGLNIKNFYGEEVLMQLDTRLETQEWYDELSMGLTYSDGVITHYNVCRYGVFYPLDPVDPADLFNVNRSTWYDTDYSNPPTDMSAILGLSNEGVYDDTVPLRFRFIAQEGTPATGLSRGDQLNPWSVTFEIYDLTNENNPVLLHSATRDRMASSVAAVRTGTAIWLEDYRADADQGVSIDTAEGVYAILSRSEIGYTDLDNDGISDSWEALYGGDLSPGLDSDGDGLSNVDEFQAGTNPNLKDSDNDGVDDDVEIAHGSDPNSASSLPAFYTYTQPSNSEDVNGNGLSDVWELWVGRHDLSLSADEDQDGYSNVDESVAGTDPLDGSSFPTVKLSAEGDDLMAQWPEVRGKRFTLYESSGFTGWSEVTGLSDTVTSEGIVFQELPDELDDTSGVNRRKFYRVVTEDLDTDGDGLTDWAEEVVLGSSADATGADSESSIRSSLVTSSGATLEGDYLNFLESLQGSSVTGGMPGSTTLSMPSAKAASRFLTQASFGVTMSEIEYVRSIGYEAWIDEQIGEAPTLHMDYIRQIKEDHNGPRADHSYDASDDSSTVRSWNFNTSFARAAVMGDDQLRQRVAFALSQIIVISRQDDTLDSKPEPLAQFYDIFVRHGFGNYKDILMEATMHPCMGWYLSHVGNQKADLEIGRFPDENFAREIMQLFTVGLWELNSDGSRKLDSSGEPIATYGNDEITELAKVFTGLWYDSEWGWGSGGWAEDHFMRPMVMTARYHDFGSKKLLGGYAIPERQQTQENGYQDIEDAVMHLFNHPNTPVFISKQLIQFLVTANPSPDYVERIQGVFVDNGSGVRGDLAAVVKAILLDEEAREMRYALGSNSFGKVREPVIRTMAVAKAFDVSTYSPQFVWFNSDQYYYDLSLQQPLYSPSVFNFFKPTYQSPGVIRDAGLVSPVLQIMDTYSAVSFPNVMWDYFDAGLRAGWDGQRYPLNFERARVAAVSDEALMDYMNLVLAGGGMTAYTRSIILETIANTSLEEDERILLAAYLTAMSPEGATQR